MTGSPEEASQRSIDPSRRLEIGRGTTWESPLGKGGWVKIGVRRLQIWLYGLGRPPWSEGMIVVCMMHEDAVLHMCGDGGRRIVKNEGVVSPGKSAVEKEGV